jgi:hypothetical protein
MGYVKHHAIVVTSWNEEAIKEAHKIATKICEQELGRSLVSTLVEGVVNTQFSFLLAPDGSKEMWSDSDKGDVARHKFIKWINEQAFGDGSNRLSYAELFFGEDNGLSEITDHN